MAWRMPAPSRRADTSTLAASTARDVRSASRCVECRRSTNSGVDEASGAVLGGCSHQSADPLLGDGGHETIRILRLDGATWPTGE